MTIEYGEKPQTPFLMPAVIRPGLPGWFREWRGLHDNLDTHQLSRQALTTDYRGLERIDLQILSMIDDARRRLGAFGVETPPRVLFTGWSAPGSLADRMTAMHPSRVKALVVGGFGATPMLPVSELDGQPFDFPIGVGDLDALIGAPFDLKTYRQIPYLLQHGEDDANDPIPDVDPKGRKQRKIVQQVLGRRPLDRIEKIRSVYDQVGAHQFELRTYRNADHGGSREIALDIQQFLEKHL
ncbi:MAG: alpha/beta hydrolase [Pseudomonadota bacterium]